MKAQKIDIDAYIRNKEKFEPYPTDSLLGFNIVDKVLMKLTPWICFLTLIYLSAQMVRAIYQGWM